MTKNTLILISILFLFLIIFLVVSVWSTYNIIVTREIEVEKKWADLQAQYQRRIDLIPNLVETTKGYAQFEQSTLIRITQLRTQWMSATSVDEKISTGTQLDSEISKLLLVFENYPELKSIETVNSLMIQLEGTENRIAVARRDYNDAVRDYNLMLRKFPSNIIAGIFGFTPKPFFEAQAEAINAPKVNITI
ncbi:MAG: LemA family protein [Candidatus Aenigmarchaeota archaeon]|nr:LemA family protein [Candidatus Aenigmarchaeota archaeon]MBU5688784.1 LemA family protein [Candidatus Aenigmarchaeota archaeon]